MFERELVQDTVQEVQKHTMEVVGNLYDELEAVTSAADSNSVKLHKVTRQNKEYLEHIKELEEQLGNAHTKIKALEESLFVFKKQTFNKSGRKKRKRVSCNKIDIVQDTTKIKQLCIVKSTNVTDQSSIETESSKDLLSLIDDEDCKHRKRFNSDSDSDDQLPVRKSRKRLSSDSETDQDLIEKTIKQSDHQVSLDDLPLDNEKCNFTQQRSEIGKAIQKKVKKSKFGKGRLVYVFHECKCWILIRAGIGSPMYLFRKGNSSEHENHCQAATKFGNKFFELTNCDGHRIITSIPGKNPGYAKMKWLKMVGFKTGRKFSNMALYSDVE